MSERPTGTDIGEMLAIVRRTAGLSVPELARAIHCSPDTVMRWEHEAPEQIVLLYRWVDACRHSLLPRNLDRS